MPLPGEIADEASSPASSVSGPKDQFFYGGQAVIEVVVNGIRRGLRLTFEDQEEVAAKLMLINHKLVGLGADANGASRKPSHQTKNMASESPSTK